MNRVVKKNRIMGTASRPRLMVLRSNKYLYAQVINDMDGKTVAGVSEKTITSEGSRMDKARQLGKLLAEKAKAQKIEKVVFDRGSYAYHGLVKAVAEGAREGGLSF